MRYLTEVHQKIAMKLPLIRCRFIPDLQHFCSTSELSIEGRMPDRYLTTSIRCSLLGRFAPVASTQGYAPRPRQLGNPGLCAWRTMIHLNNRRIYCGDLCVKLPHDYLESLFLLRLAGCDMARMADGHGRSIQAIGECEQSSGCPDGTHA